MLMKLLGICCALAATGTVLVYGFGLQVQRPIAPLDAKQPAPVPTPKAQVVATLAPVHAPADTSTKQEPVNDVPVNDMPVNDEPVAQVTPTAEALAPVLNAATVSPETIEVIEEPVVSVIATQSSAQLPVEATAEQVFVFWQPFRSRGSAQGFAQGLSARAEVPISVISEDTKAGRQYRVVLPYDTEVQRLERLAKLESATRLEMGE